MNNIWSRNKYVEIVINILIYLMSMNFLHYGQLILPLICLIIFIDRKFKFYVKDIKIFIILCLFGISFFAFSYYLGFYSVMGLCFPMAYYIGSNLSNNKEDSIKKVIYLMILGMITHYFLNFVYELNRFGWIKTLTKSTRYDFWLQNEFVSTGTATNAVILLSIIYYILVKEKNNAYKIIGIILFVFTVFYTFIMRRRTQLLMIVISFVLSLIFDFLIKKPDKKEKKKIAIIFIGMIFFFVILYLIYKFIPFVHYFIINNSIFAFSKIEGFGLERLEILIEGIKYIPSYIFGGQKISTIVGMPFHDLLLNIYDFAGIVPMTFMFIYIAISLINIYKALKSDTISNDFKLLLLEITIGFAIMCFMEPLMTGSSLFMIIGILIEACIELLI